MLGYIIGGIVIVCILAAIIIVLALKRKKHSTVTLDDIIGERGIVVERVDNFAGCGIVKVKGCLWAARGVTDDDVFEAGESLMIVAIEGVKLVCKSK